MTQRDRDLLSSAIAGGIATLPWVVAAVGWTAHWNALLNLLLTVGGGVLWFVIWACCSPRYRKDVTA